jgi:glyceraldehyde-3-phosphate dehydrogenase/erythrose-4-phosphate dehydrogenase
MEATMNIDQIIESYTYARITGSAKPLDHLDLKAEQIVQSAPSQTQAEIDVLFANDEYEAKLRYIRNENANRES